MSIVSNLIVLMILFYLTNKYGIVTCCGKNPKINWKATILITAIGMAITYLTWSIFLKK